jgi:hypothetical protein
MLVPPPAAQGLQGLQGFAAAQGLQGLQAARAVANGRLPDTAMLPAAMPPSTISGIIVVESRYCRLGFMMTSLVASHIPRVTQGGLCLETAAIPGWSLEARGDAVESRCFTLT